MPATTITTIVLIAFALGILALTFRAYFGSWEPRTPQHLSQARRQAEIDLAVRELRQEIGDYERRNTF